MTTIRNRNHENNPLRKDISECLHNVLPSSSRANIFDRSTRVSSFQNWHRTRFVVGILLLILLLATTSSFSGGGEGRIPRFNTQPQKAGVRGKEITEIGPPAKLSRDKQEPAADGDDSMKLSLWLMPPGGGGDDETEDDRDSVFDRVRKVVNGLSAERNGPRFLPHVTIVGGIEVRSEGEAAVLAETLRAGLSGFGPVDCSFGDLLLSAPDCWNQALVAELVPPSEDFESLCKLSRTLLGMEQQEHTANGAVTFPPPLGIPHMSLYYGDSPPPPSGEYLSEIFGNQKKAFRTHRVMLWKTDPSSVEGVPEWEPLADISLL